MMQPPSFRSRRRVQFRDTDAAGIVHFSAFFTYMEEAEHEFLRSLGTSVHLPLTASQEHANEAPPPGSKISWPRVAAECQYRGAARFEEEVDIELRVQKLGRSSVTYGFEFFVGDRHIASGSLTSVCCRIVPDEPPAAVSMPESIRKQLSDRVNP